MFAECAACEEFVAQDDTTWSRKCDVRQQTGFQNLSGLRELTRVYQPGYLFKSQLLRPARVVVKQWNG